MKVVGGVVVLAVAMAMMPQGAIAQDKQDKQDKPTEEKARAPRLPAVMRTVYLQNASQPNDGNEILTAVRLLDDPGTKMYLTPSQNSITIGGTEEEVAMAEKLIKELDKPKKTYRLSFTMTETDGGKKIGEMHSAMDVVVGQRTTMKNGSKVPVATGSYSATGSPGTQTQFTYLDVGLNIDVTLDEYTGGARLKAKVEQSSIGETREIAGVVEPVVRQTVLEGTSLLTMGKPVSLGSLDVTGSTRHLEISVELEPAK